MEGVGEDTWICLCVNPGGGELDERVLRAGEKGIEEEGKEEGRDDIDL